MPDADARLLGPEEPGVTPKAGCAGRPGEAVEAPAAWRPGLGTASELGTALDDTLGASGGAGKTGRFAGIVCTRWPVCTPTEPNTAATSTAAVSTPADTPARRRL